MAEPGFWDRLGVDDGGLPTHLPMAVDEQGRGPVPDRQAWSWVCWCPDEECLLTQALMEAWRAGLRVVTTEEE
jgi:hypothetical protein